MMTLEEAMKKASKLLKLSESSNANEAALAAGMAQKILSKYNIDRATLSLDDKGGFIEDIKKGETLEDGGGRLASWKSMLASKIARVNSCRVYLTGSSIGIVGRDTDIGKVRYFYAFLSLEIEKLVKIQAKGQGRSFATSFRIGAVEAIGEKLQEASKLAEKEARESTVNEAGLVLVNRALAKMREDDQAVDQWMRDNMNLGTRRSSYSGNDAGRAAGYRAGQSVNVGGSNRAVGSGQRRLGS